MNSFEGCFSFLPKILGKHLWNIFSPYLLVEILQLLHEISSFSEVLYNRGVLKNSKFTDKLKKQSYGSVLSNDVLKNFAKLTESRCGYIISKSFVKLTRFKSFPLQLPGHQDIALLSFARVASWTLIRCGWVLISASSVENCTSVERLNTLNNDLKSLLQNIKKFAAG